MNKKTEAIIEAVLFANGQSVQISKLCDITGCQTDEIIAALENLKNTYDDEKRGITLVKFEDSYQLCTKSDLYEYVRILNEKRTRQPLSNAALEVLSIIAYNQPVTRSSIEFIRGVSSDGPLSKLLELGLAEEKGRLDAPGRPMLFGTTEEFLRCFGLSSISDLPDVDNEKLLASSDLAAENT